jgi:hypothetical protein
VDVTQFSGCDRPDIACPFCAVCLGVITVFNQSYLIFCTVKRMDFGKNMINMILARPHLLLGQNNDQGKSLWIPHDSRYCLRTADRLTFNYYQAFAFQKIDFFMLVREVKPGFI